MDSMMPFVALHHAHSTDTERNKHTTRVYQPNTHTQHTKSMLQKYVIIWCTAHMSLHPPKVWPCRQRRISRLKVQPLASKRLQLGKKTSSALRQHCVSRLARMTPFRFFACTATLPNLCPTQCVSHSRNLSLTDTDTHRHSQIHTQIKS